MQAKQPVGQVNSSVKFCMMCFKKYTILKVRQVKTFLVKGAQYPMTNILTHCGPVTPYDNIDWANTGSGNGLLPYSTKPLPQSTHVDWSSVGSSDIHLTAISWETSQPSISKIVLKIIYLNFHQNLPEANELNMRLFIMPFIHCFFGFFSLQNFSRYYSSAIILNGQQHLVGSNGDQIRTPYQILTLVALKPANFGRTLWIPWLLMTWWHKHEGTFQDKQVLVFHKERFQLPVPSHCRVIKLNAFLGHQGPCISMLRNETLTENENTFLIHSKKHSARQGLKFP